MRLKILEGLKISPEELNHAGFIRHGKHNGDVAYRRGSERIFYDLYDGTISKAWNADET